MASIGRIRFTLNGQQYELSRADVEDRLADVTPDVIRKHAVRVNDTWFPAIQAFEVAIRVPRSEFISHTARRHLAALGFEVHGDIESRTFGHHAEARQVTQPTLRAVHPFEAELDESWHTEENVQAAAVSALAGQGWRILSVANTATKEHGIDIVASHDGQTVGIEVKGFPSRHYADPARAGETKKTSPSTQAVHWYSQALLAAMRLRGKEPSWMSVVVLPDFPRYQSLHAETKASLEAAEIKVWWITADGTLIS
jgi:Holliday junction resolvase-like predicted endonuclease